jgi:hypothetical protein
MTDGPAAPESREPASVAAEARPLSPAAQAVLDAFWKRPGDRLAIAAALRAAVNFSENLYDSQDGKTEVIRVVDLEAWAAELEGSN